MAGLQLTLHLTVYECPGCGGSHPTVTFTPGHGPTSAHTHTGRCPDTGQEWWLDTQSADNGGVWRRLLAAAGIKE